MKKLILVSALAVASNAALASGGEREIGYDRGELGYEALIAGDNEKALKQLKESTASSKDDPAKLINLGRAYERLGRYAEAANMFRAAMNCRRQFDLELSDGSIINSRDAARLSLERLESNIATR